MSTIAVGWDDLIEFPSLDSLVDNTSQHELLVAVLAWLRQRLLDAELNGAVELEIVEKSYLGSYPVMGLRVADKATCSAMAQQIERQGEALLASATMGDFLQFASTASEAWSERRKALLSTVNRP